MEAFAKMRGGVVGTPIPIVLLFDFRIGPADIFIARVDVIQILLLLPLRSLSWFTSDNSLSQFVHHFF